MGNLLFGALCLTGGLLVTLLTYSNPGPGGRFVIAYGAIAVGVVQLLRGLAELGSDVRPTSGAPSPLAVDPEPTPQGSKALDHDGRTVIVHPDGKVRAKNALGWRSFSSVDEYLKFVGAKRLPG